METHSETAAGSDLAVALRPAEIGDVAQLRELARAAYPDTLLSLCLETLDFHEQCLQHGLDDGRSLFVLERQAQPIGGCGLHRYIWGPRDVCWGSWFFIAPQFRRPGLALLMFRALVCEAKAMGFTRLYVETPAADPHYARLALYLPRGGFKLEASLPDHYAPGVDQLIYSLRLAR